MGKQPKKYEPNAPSPKALFENFLFFFFWNMKICSLSKSEEDEDEDEDENGVKVMKILFMMIFFFFFEKPIRWMRITLARSWCGLLDKSFSILAKR